MSQYIIIHGKVIEPRVGSRYMEYCGEIVEIRQGSNVHYRFEDPKDHPPPLALSDLVLEHTKGLTIVPIGYEGGFLEEVVKAHVFFKQSWMCMDGCCFCKKYGHIGFLQRQNPSGILDLKRSCNGRSQVVDW